MKRGDDLDATATIVFTGIVLRKPFNQLSPQIVTTAVA